MGDWFPLDRGKDDDHLRTGRLPAAPDDPVDPGGAEPGEPADPPAPDRVEAPDQPCDELLISATRAAYAILYTRRELIARAFARLPERWQAVLWHTEVEGEKPAAVARCWRLTAGSTPQPQPARRDHH